MAVVTRFPTANAVYTNGGFTDPNNLHADDGAYGTSAPAKNNGKGTAYSAFGFDGVIPSGSTIDAVKILYEFKVSGTGSVAIQRVKARIGGVEEENHDNTNEPTTDTPVTVDITADRTWARDDLLDANFEAIAEPRRGNSNNAYTASWDYIKVEVTYTAPPPSPQTLTGSAGITSGLAFGSGGTVTPGAVSLTGSAGIVSGLAFGSGGSISIGAAGQTLTGSAGIISGLAFGSGGTLTSRITLTGSAGIASALAFGSGGSLTPGAVTLTGVAGIPSGLVFGSGGQVSTPGGEAAEAERVSVLRQLASPSGMI